MTVVKSFLKSTHGQDLVEYALLVVLVGVGLILAVRFLTDTLASVYSEASQGIAETVSQTR
jgi:Flp pilus assembly pilin Flp